MEIDRKSIGVLIDELITTSLKCWFAQEVVMSSKDEKELATAAKKAQLMNARRNALIRAIDERLGESDISPTDKTYA
jgi:hypothetical protein